MFPQMISYTPALAYASAASLREGFACILYPHDFDRVAQRIATWTEAERTDAEVYIRAVLAHEVEGAPEPTEPAFIRIARTGG